MPAMTPPTTMPGASVTASARLTTEPGVLRIATCDDHPAIALAMQQVLEADDAGAPLEVVGTFDTAEALLARWAELQPDVVVLDVRLSGEGTGVEGLELAARLRERERVGILFYSAMDDPAVVRRAIEDGADGFVSKAATPQELVAAVRRVAAGERPVLDGTTATQLAVAVMDGMRVPGLSTREREVLELVAKGMTNARIGSQLGITENSVKSLLKRALGKLDAPDRAAAVAEGFRRGLLR